MLSNSEGKQRMQRLATFLQRHFVPLLFSLWVTSITVNKDVDAASIYNEDGKPGVALKRVISDTSKVANLTRRHNGDVFYSYGK